MLARLPDSPLRHRLQHLTLFRATGYFRISFPVTQTPRGKCNCSCFVLGVWVLPMRLYCEASRAAASAACFCATVRRGDQSGESILLADLISCKTAHAASVEKSCRHREIIKLWHEQISFSQVHSRAYGVYKSKQQYQRIDCSCCLSRDLINPHVHNTCTVLHLNLRWNKEDDVSWRWR